MFYLFEQSNGEFIKAKEKVLQFSVAKLQNAISSNAF